MRPTVEMPKSMILRYNILNRKGEKVVQVYHYQNAIWVKGKGTKSDRTCIGKEDLSTGRLIPNDKYFEIYHSQDQNNYLQNYPTGSYEDISFGDYYILNYVAKQLKLINCLESVFDKKGKEILFLAQCMLRNGNSIKEVDEWTKTVYSFMKWNKNYRNQRASDLFSSITDSQISSFFSRWIEACDETDSVAYDVTSISSYSDNLTLVEFGYNRDHEDLKQINLSVLYSVKSNHALFYEVYKGSINDKSFLTTFLENAKKLGLKPKRYVMDRGFYAKKNLEYLEINDIKYLMCTQINYLFVQEELKKIGDISTSYAQRLEKHDLYGIRVQINSGRFIYLFMNSYRKEFDLLKMKLQMKNLLTKFENNDELTEKDIRHAEKYFDIIVDKSTNTAVKWEINDEKINTQFSKLGYFSFVSNELLELDDVIDIYQERIKVEVNYDNLKNDIGLKRTGAHSDRTLQGKIFVAFIASILKSKISEALESFKKKYETMNVKEKKEVSNLQNDSVKNILTILAGIKVQIDLNTNLTCLHHPLTKKDSTILSLLGIDPLSMPEVIKKVSIN
jgi:transposase